MTTIDQSSKSNLVVDWFIRFLKGILVGIGFIAPGLSGGVLAVVFGIYEPMMRFLAHLREKFIQNLLYFLPVGIGGVIGVVVFSFLAHFGLENYPDQFTWLFIGFIVGNLPLLFKTAGKQGRKWWHWLILLLIGIGTAILLLWFESKQFVQLEGSFINWMLSGALIGLGVVVPGMSPSNLLLYFGMYEPMTKGISRIDLSVIIPLVLGGIICVLLFARLVSWLFKRFYALMCHLILGVVIGSTIAILPLNVRGWALVVSIVLFFLGIVISFLFAKLEEKYSREEIVI
jgi:putative membrane protein